VLNSGHRGKCLEVLDVYPIVLGAQLGKPEGRGIEAFHAAQLIVDILGRPIWWCEVWCGVVVIKL